MRPTNEIKAALKHLRALASSNGFQVEVTRSRRGVLPRVMLLGPFNSSNWTVRTIDEAVTEIETYAINHRGR